MFPAGVQLIPDGSDGSREVALSGSHLGHVFQLAGVGHVVGGLVLGQDLHHGTQFQPPLLGGDPVAERRKFEGENSNFPPRDEQEKTLIAVTSLICRSNITRRTCTEDVELNLGFNLVFQRSTLAFFPCCSCSITVKHTQQAEHREVKTTRLISCGNEFLKMEKMKVLRDETITCFSQTLKIWNGNLSKNLFKTLFFPQHTGNKHFC